MSKLITTNVHTYHTVYINNTRDAYNYRYNTFRLTITIDVLPKAFNVIKST